jgi:hypothetical protein
VREKMKEIELEHVVELCFEWMIDPKMLVSVRSSASEALFNLPERANCDDKAGQRAGRQGTVGASSKHHSRGQHLLELLRYRWQLPLVLL